MSRYPEPTFTHVARLTDDTGMFEHARGPIPLRHHGYCLDDVARALMVVCREPDPSADLIRLAERYLSFVVHAQATDGTFHNRLSYARRWTDDPGTGDWWGRAIWGLGTAVARSPAGWIRDGAMVCFDAAAAHRSQWTRSMAFAGIGAAEVLRVRPDHTEARRLLADAAATVGRPGDTAWPEPRLTYANAILAEVHLAAGSHLDDESEVQTGLRMLDWLLAVDTTDGHLSPTPVGGWALGEPRPAFDQQPIEAAATADACARAAAMTGDEKWNDGLRRSIDWFLGDNDAEAPVANPLTGGCGDGLGPTGRSDNEGAESTLALISTLQHGRDVRRPRHAD